MKKLFVLGALILIVGLTYGQNLQKGTLVGVHNVTITLQPGATMEQFTDFFLKKYKPEMEKLYPEWKVYLTKGVRGENSNSIGWIFIVKEKDRDKYYNPDGTRNDYAKDLDEKAKPIMEEMKKICTYTTKYTDWVVQ